MTDADIAWFGDTLRRLRQQAGLSQAQTEALHGIDAVVVGSYERGDRQPPIGRADAALRAFGWKLAAVPADLDVDGVAAELAELRAFKRLVGAAVKAASESITIGDTLDTLPDTAPHLAAERRYRA